MENILEDILIASLGRKSAEEVCDLKFDVFTTVPVMHLPFCGFTIKDGGLEVWELTAGYINEYANRALSLSFELCLLFLNHSMVFSVRNLSTGKTAKQPQFQHQLKLDASVGVYREI